MQLMEKAETLLLSWMGSGKHLFNFSRQQKFQTERLFNTQMKRNNLTTVTQQKFVLSSNSYAEILTLNVMV